MGSEMAGHLLSKGHQLIVYDVAEAAVAAMTKKGAVAAQSPAEVGQRCDRVMTMLPTPSHVLECYGGKNGILSGAKPGSILMDSSTIDPRTSQQVANLASEKGVIFMDTPVSGAVPAARAASLTFMVGGDERHIDEVRDLLLCMGKNVVPCGPVGNGAVAKICNNMMLAISMVGTAETLNLGKRLGLEPKLLTQILNISSGRTWSSEVYNPVPGIMPNVPAANNYQGGFTTQLITKDLGLAQSAATQTNSPIPLGILSHQIFRLMLNNGYATKDFSAVYQFLQQQDEKAL